jgi:glutamate synthase domain-containing protein 1
MGILNYDHDEINTAMVDGLKNGSKDELKQILMETAEREIEPIIEKLSERIKLDVCNWPDFFNDARKIKLEWLITKEI